MIIKVLSKVPESHVSKNTKDLYSFSRSGLLDDLNKVIEWEFTDFPLHLKPGADPVFPESYEKHTKILGDEPQLSPGTVFQAFTGVYLVVSPTEIVLLRSDTGAGCLKELTESILPLELEILDSSPAAAEFKEVPTVPEGCIRTDLGYYWQKIFRERFKYGRFQDPSVVEVTVTESDTLICPVKLYFHKWGVYSNPKDGISEYIGVIGREVVAHLIKTYPREGCYDFDREKKLEEVAVKDSGNRDKN